MRSRQELIDYLVMCAGWLIKDDAISRVDVIKAVHDGMYDEHTDKTSALRRVMNAIGDMPTVNVAPQWIPCSKEMPDEYEPVLTSTTRGDIRIMERVMERSGFMWKDEIADYLHDIDFAQAWMPLPEWYKVEE